MVVWLSRNASCDSGACTPGRSSTSPRLPKPLGPCLHPLSRQRSPRSECHVRFEMGDHSEPRLRSDRNPIGTLFRHSQCWANGSSYLALVDGERLGRAQRNLVQAKVVLAARGRCPGAERPVSHGSLEFPAGDRSRTLERRCVGEIQGGCSASDNNNSL